MLEHPVITRMERWGDLYPRKIEFECDLCGTPVETGYDYYDIDGLYVCERCVDRSRKTAGED